MGSNIQMQEISRRLVTELRSKVDAVQQTESWSREGKRARRRLKGFLAELRDLAIANGQQMAIDGMEKVRLLVLGNVMRPVRLSCEGTAFRISTMRVRTSPSCGSSFCRLGRRR